MKKAPGISVIMSVYNVAPYLDESIDSVLSQDFSDFELIIIDDRSTDNSWDIIEKYLRKDKRIRTIRNKENLGLTKSLNKGIDDARGRFIAIFDSDDVMMPDALSTMYKYLKKNKDVYLVGGWVICIDNEGREFDRWRQPTDEKQIDEILKRKNCIWHNTILFRNTREFRYREKFRYAQDYDLYTLMKSAGKKLVNLPFYAAKYRIHSSSTSYSKRARQLLFVRKIAELYSQRRERGVDDYDSFDPSQIMDFDVERSDDKEILYNEIRISWRFDDVKRMRRLAKRYFKMYGIFNKACLYYIASFTDKRFIAKILNIKRAIRKPMRRKMR